MNVRWLLAPRGLLRRVVQALPAIVLAIAGSYLLSRAGTLNELERFVLDAELTARPAPSDQIAVVLISDTDYDHLFSGRSPLDPDRLHSIIGAIARSHPRVIGVDIDTSPPQFRRMARDPDWPTVIWERDVAAADETRAGELEPLDVLGGADLRLNGMSGIPALLDDPDDKLTRLYSRCVATKAGAERSFVFAAVAGYRAGAHGGGQALPGCSGPADTAPRIIRFSLRERDLDLRTAGQVVGYADEQSAGGNGEPFPDLRDRIVLLGGAYRDWDRHHTPLGLLPGTMVLANAIQAEMDGGGVAAPSKLLLFALEFVASAALMLLLPLVAPTPLRALVYGLALTIAIALVCSFATMGSLAGLTIFLPTLGAVLLFEIYEHLRLAAILRAAGTKANP